MTDTIICAADDDGDQYVELADYVDRITAERIVMAEALDDRATLADASVQQLIVQRFRDAHDQLLADADDPWLEMRAHGAVDTLAELLLTIARANPCGDGWRDEWAEVAT